MYLAMAGASPLVQQMIHKLEQVPVKDYIKKVQTKVSNFHSMGKIFWDHTSTNWNKRYSSVPPTRAPLSAGPHPTARRRSPRRWPARASLRAPISVPQNPAYITARARSEQLRPSRPRRTSPAPAPRSTPRVVVGLPPSEVAGLPPRSTRRPEPRAGVAVPRAQVRRISHLHWHPVSTWSDCSLLITILDWISLLSEVWIKRPTRS